MKYSKQVSRVILSSVIAIFAVISAGCGADSMQDTTNQERDRQRQMASVLEKDYSTVDGVYASVSPALLADSTQFYVIAHIKMRLITKDTLVPEPTLNGSFRIFKTAEMNQTVRRSTVSDVDTVCNAISQTDLEKIYSPHNEQNCGTLFPFTTGTYDSLSKVMALHIQGNDGVSGDDVQCTRLDNNSWTCSWPPSTGSIGFNFTIAKSL